MTAATECYFVSRTLRTLEALAARPLSSGELAELIGVHPRTARRLLARLAHESYAVRLGDRRNRIGTQRLVDRSRGHGKARLRGLWRRWRVAP